MISSTVWKPNPISKYNEDERDSSRTFRMIFGVRKLVNASAPHYQNQRTTMEYDPEEAKRNMRPVYRWLNE